MKTKGESQVTKLSWDSYTTAQRVAFSPTNPTIVFDTDEDKFYKYNLIEWLPIGNDDSVITLGRLQQISTDTFLGRDTAGTGDVEVLTPAQVRSILNVADGATANDTDANLLNRANHTGTQTMSTISDAGALATLSTVGTTELTNNAVTLAKFQQIATDSFIGRDTASTGDIEVLSAAAARGILNVADGATANSSDATLLDRANHTGTQTLSTISDSGTLAGLNSVATGNLDNNAVTLAKFQQISTNSFIGRDTAGTGDIEVLSAADVRGILNVADGATANDTDANLLNRANHTGSQAMSTISDAGALATLNTVSSTEIDDEAITLAKLAHIATDSFLGRDTASTGDVEVLSAATARSILNVADGATANSTDVFLLGRANHTGTQAASTISDFASTVRGTTLTGLSVATSTDVVAGDTVLQGIGKLQGQLDGLTKTGVYREIWIPANAMTKRATNGAEAGTFETTTNDINIDYYAFDNGTEEGVNFHISLPLAWDTTAGFKAKFYWDSAASGSGTVTWGIAAVGVGNGGTTDSAFGTEQTVVDTIQTVGDTHRTSATSTITPSGSPSNEFLIFFRVVRKTGGSSVDAHLYGVKLQYLELTTEPSGW